MKKATGFNLGYLLLAAVGVYLLQTWWIQSQAVATIPYSQFQKLVREDKIARVTVSQDQLRGEFKDAIDGRGASSPSGSIPRWPRSSTSTASPTPGSSSRT